MDLLANIRKTTPHYAAIVDSWQDDGFGTKIEVTDFTTHYLVSIYLHEGLEEATYAEGEQA